MKPDHPLAVITGASSGIGKAIAQRFAARGYDLVLVARREETLTELAESLKAAHGIACVPYRADLARREEREELVRQLEDDAGRIEVLVNNAGFGTHGFFRETDLDRELELIEVNCAAPVHLAKRVLPWMLARKKGYIMNVGSVAAFAPGPVMALYYGSKAFVLSFSEALWEECQGTGVTVTALCPGPVKTEFQRVAGLAAGARTSGAPAMTPDVVAAEGVQAMFAGERVVIPGRANRWLALAARYLPRSRTLKSVRKIQEERRRQTLAAKGGTQKP
jgi:uncharacterized protein